MARKQIQEAPSQISFNLNTSDVLVASKDERFSPFCSMIHELEVNVRIIPSHFYCLLDNG